jgi:GNAT superfamily N-acetyltransferase
VALINQAYLVESFFVEGPRTSEESIRALIGKGEMLALDGNATELFVTAHLRCAKSTGHLGLISVVPKNQGQGLGRRMIAVAEGLATAHGCQRMKLQVVNLRSELIAYYTDLGYRKTGTSEFAASERTLQPVHFIDMEKRLGAAN